MGSGGGTEEVNGVTCDGLFDCCIVKTIDNINTLSTHEQTTLFDLNERTKKNPTYLQTFLKHLFARLADSIDVDLIIFEDHVITHADNSCAR